jgi:hypothetical protein
VGWAIIAVACGLSWVAHTTSALLWPVVFIVAWFGGYQTVYARGCRIGVGETDTVGSSAADQGELLDAPARRTRARMGAGFLLIATLVAVLAGWRWFWLWPLAFLVAWFGASFLVAAATRYPGCPEVGAIPSLVLRRRLVTRCPPMERLDHTVESRS